jgi:thiamine-phosphate pyrophosphorylase
MRLHAIVDDLQTAYGAAEGGATVLQLRLKGRSTIEIVETGRPFRSLAARHGIPFVVNDDVEAALQLGADGVHLGRTDAGQQRALELGLLLGRSASSVEEAEAGERAGAAYIGAGPVWATPSKEDADAPIGLDGLAAIAAAVAIPVIAIGGIDADNAPACVEAGAAGVAVIRAAAHARELTEALERAGL